MLINKKNGISLVVLVCVIFIMAVLATTIIVSFNNISVATKKKEFATEIYSIQKLVDQYRIKNNDKYPVTGYTVSIDLSNSSKEFSIQCNENGEASESSNEITLYYLDLYEAGVTETNRGQKKEDNDVYAVSEKTGKVYYLKGFKAGGTTYYTLTDELKTQIGLLK